MLIDGNEILANLTGKILVLMDEPTADTKKKLRLDIDEDGSLYGRKRELLLRNIIPVIEFDSRNWLQLEGDLIYFKDNFGGVGFWPLFVEPKEKTENPDEAQKLGETNSVSGHLVKFFQQESRNGQPDSMLNKFVCENRWWFYMALAVLLILTICLFWKRYQSCVFREHVNKYFKWYVLGLGAPIAMIIVPLALYDPVSEDFVKKWGVTVLIIILVVGYYFWERNRRKSHAKKPARPRKRLLATKNSG